MNKILHGDCLELMKDIPNGSIDMILCDLPYGVLNKLNHNAKWDCIIPFADLWEQYNRLLKDNGVVILFSQGMFTAELMFSNKKNWRYNLCWDKVAKTGFLNSKKMPLRQHEDIVVFYKSLPTYNPQMKKCEPHKRNHSKGNMKRPQKNSCYGEFSETPTIISDEKFPTSIISIPKEHAIGKFYHPTQKPVALFEYLIKTYTNDGELVLDNTAGSCTTAIAALETGRNYICMEKEEKYYNIGVQRVKDWYDKQGLFNTNING